MNKTSYSFLTLQLILINFTLLAKAVPAINDNQVTTSSSILQSFTDNSLYYYERFFFFFLANHTRITLVDFRNVLNQLGELDDYCGGEIVRTLGKFSTRGYFNISDQSSLKDVFDAACNGKQGPTKCYNESIVPEAIAWYNFDDTGQMVETLVDQVNLIWPDNNDNKNPLISRQAILITNYVTDSLKEETIISKLLEMKNQRNISFIALNTALWDGSNTSAYFPESVWNVYTDYLQWTENITLYSQRNITINPICDYKMNQYTTPSPLFDGLITLNIYLLLSHDFLYQSKNETIDLFSRLAARRWQYPCRQCRRMNFQFTIPSSSLPPDDSFAYAACNVENSSSDGPIDGNVCTPQTERWSWFSDWLNEEEATYADNITCKHYDAFFQQVTLMWTQYSLFSNKFLLITNVPMKCPDFTPNIFKILSNYSDYAAGAPLTVITIDEVNERTVADSFSNLFPPTQAPNLYKINNISDLLENISNSIYFCLDAVPALPVNPIPVPSHYSSLWYLYMIGGIIVIALIAIPVFFVTRNKIRKWKIRKIQRDMEMATTTNVPPENNQYIETSLPRAVDIWEIPVNSLYIFNKELIGKGAFALVHAGFLKGKAPILDVYPSFTLQNYVDCDVAVKTLPQHFREADKALFLNEIRLMKDIGYHIHLVSMLGCNCSIETPFLVLELAEQSLLHWLIHMNTANHDTEMNLAKTLSSFSWQISDGMNYLSSKLFVHRDLAARNILLNKDMKAMVSDFGLCQKLDHADQVITITGGKVPLKWMALESLLEHQFSTKTDVWSFGVLLYEIYNLGKEPYGNVSGEELRTLLQEGKRLEQPRLADELIYELMKQCCHMKPASRPDFATIQKVFEGILEGSSEYYGYLQTIYKRNSVISVYNA